MSDNSQLPELNTLPENAKTNPYIKHFYDPSKKGVIQADGTAAPKFKMDPAERQRIIKMGAIFVLCFGFALYNVLPKSMFSFGSKSASALPPGTQTMDFDPGILATGSPEEIRKMMEGRVLNNTMGAPGSVNLEGPESVGPPPKGSKPEKN